MKPTQAIKQEIRRHPDRCIDFDFYRTRAVALRGQAMRDAFTLRTMGAGILTMTGVVAVVLLVAAAPMRAPSSHAAVEHTNAVQIR